MMNELRFIEVTDIRTHRKVLIKVDSITRLWEADNGYVSISDNVSKEPLTIKEDLVTVKKQIEDVLTVNTFMIFYNYIIGGYYDISRTKEIRS